MTDIERKKYTFSPKWETVDVYGRFGEAEDSEKFGPWPERTAESMLEHYTSISSNMECRIFALPTPIFVNVESVKSIIDTKYKGKSLRIYPPFPLNEGGETAGALKGAKLPQGTSIVTSEIKIPDEPHIGAYIGYQRDKTAYCRGIRIDMESDLEANAAVQLLLDHICQYTYQWWLRARNNPFFGPMRLRAHINDKFEIVETLRARGMGATESSWLGMHQLQKHLGFGGSLTDRVWRSITRHISNNESADTGVLSFNDAFASYMAGDINNCILSLCIAVEVMLSKHRALIEKKSPNQSLEKLIRASQFLTAGTKADLSKLSIDRDHVAHGRRPYILGHDPAYTIDRYIHATMSVLRAYLGSIPKDIWPQIMSELPGRVRR